MRFLLLLLLALPAYAQGPTIMRGNLGTQDCGRPDATLCIQAPTSPTEDQLHSNVTIDLSLFPCNPLAEGMLNFQGRNTGNHNVQMGSVSALWSGGCDGSLGYSVLRLNSTYNGGWSSDIQYRQWGGRGIGLFRLGDNDHCGGRFLCITRTPGFASIAGSSDLVLNGTPNGMGDVFINSYGTGTVRVAHGGGQIQIGTPVSNVCPNGWKECIRMLDSNGATMYLQVGR